MVHSKDIAWFLFSFLPALLLAAIPVLLTESKSSLQILALVTICSHSMTNLFQWIELIFPVCMGFCILDGISGALQLFTMKGRVIAMLWIGGCVFLSAELVL